MAEAAPLIEHFFRHEKGRLHGALIRLLGLENLSLAEDLAQEAMLRALRHWSMGGVPPNPSAWITQVAMNLARDALRHGRVAAAKREAILAYLDQNRPVSLASVSTGAQEIRDDMLRLLFACCHPEIGTEAQVVLALKIICGFTTGEIARAYFSSEAAIEKQLTRTKQRIQAAGLRFEIPEGEDLAPRLEGVLAALYLLFNEGYKASEGERLLREDLCREAIRLGLVLVEHPAADVPRSHALLSLMLLSAARFPARVDEHGALLRLDGQDRSKWDRSLLDQGLIQLALAARGGEVSEYHLQAGIAALHGTAADFASTDWVHILRHYDELLAFKPSPMVALNRVVALAQVEGPAAALRALETMPHREKLESHHLLHAVTGELFERLGRHEAAARSYRRALDLARVGPEQAHLQLQLERTRELARS